MKALLALSIAAALCASCRAQDDIALGDILKTVEHMRANTAALEKELDGTKAQLSIATQAGDAARDELTLLQAKIGTLARFAEAEHARAEDLAADFDAMKKRYHRLLWMLSAAAGIAAALGAWSLLGIFPIQTRACAAVIAAGIAAGAVWIFL